MPPELFDEAQGGRRLRGRRLAGGRPARPSCADARAGAAVRHRPDVRAGGAGASGEARPPAFAVVRYRELDDGRPPLPALRDAARVRRRLAGGAAAVRVACWRSATRGWTRSSGGRWRRSAPTTCSRRVRLRHGAADRRQADARALPSATRTCRARHEDAPDGFLLAYGPAVAPGRKEPGVGRRRRAHGALFPRACRSRTTWTATRADRHLPPRIHASDRPLVTGIPTYER